MEQKGQLIVRVQKMIRNTSTRRIYNCKRYRIDKAKLYDAIWDKGYTKIMDFSVDAGFGISTVSSAASNGFMTKAMIAVIESMGIPPDVYVLGELTTQEEDKPAEKEKVPEQIEKHGVVVEQATPTEDAMYRATYTAIMNTWSFIREDLKAIIKEALSE